jgi:hypothetical protein
MEALTVGFRSNEYASGSCIRKQEIEGFNKVFSLHRQRTVKRTDTDGLTKEKQEEKYEVRGTVQSSSNQS